MLREIKNTLYHYFIDKQGLKQGEYKAWYIDGVLMQHCAYIDNQLHGEYKLWYGNSRRMVHCFYVNSLSVTVV